MVATSLAKKHTFQFQGETLSQRNKAENDKKGYLSPSSGLHACTQAQAPPYTHVPVYTCVCVTHTDKRKKE